jgi:hypothetical protein
MSFIGKSFAVWSLSSLLLAYPSLAADRLSSEIKKIQNEISKNRAAYKNLHELSVDIGPRLGGSPAAARAVAWGVAKFKSYKLDRVWTQPVEVPRWVRGTVEKASITIDGATIPLALTALGRSAGTKGLDAPVIEVHSLAEAQALGEQARGKIIFFNRPMDPSLADTFAAYGQAVDQRAGGANVASKLGAVATLVRSMTTLPDDDHPHAGGTSFKADVKPIPAAALSTHAANILSKKLLEAPGLILHLELSAETLPPVISQNVIGEIKGRELPNEFVVVGGHLDSWDLGQGAHDDGAGVVQSMDVCRAIKHLRLKPKRTIRCVLFMSEELGGIGGQEYARQAKLNQERHVMAVESDRGGFEPEKFSIEGHEDMLPFLSQNLAKFAGTGIKSFYMGGSGTDVEPLSELGALTMELVPNPKHYFDFHHAASDRFEAVNELELKHGAAAMATMVLIFANR